MNNLQRTLLNLQNDNTYTKSISEKFIYFLFISIPFLYVFDNHLSQIIRVSSTTLSLSFYLPFFILGLKNIKHIFRDYKPIVYFVILMTIFLLWSMDIKRG